ncbi:MAG: 30S ribosomal protein S1 [Candidatus Eisenbacteria bacterium]|nr:30S ribosomal protein S1 [Candidatus Eisenbacteria bacterium]
MLCWKQEDFLPMTEEPKHEEQQPTESAPQTPAEASSDPPAPAPEPAASTGASSAPPAAESPPGNGEPDGESPAGSGEPDGETPPETETPDPSAVRGRVRLVNRDEPDEADGEHVRDLIGMYVDSLRNLEEGEVLRGRVLRVDEKDVLVDVGFKSEGIIPLEEFGDVESIKVGDEIDVFLERIEDDQGMVVLSKQRADFVKVWDRVREAAEKGEVVEGRLVRKIKGGVVVDLFGVEAFLPGSQIALRQPRDIESLMSQTLKFKIIKLNKRRRNIVVSRRLVLEEERERAKEQILKELEVGQVREGYVKNITDFGAFIDLGGIDGLLHITDMSWGRIRHPSEVVTVGDKVKVKLLSFDPERERISLGLKQLEEYPWERVDDKYPVGTKVQGRVVSITDYGAFIELEKGVEGLIHISEMSWTKHIRHPSKILSEGQEIECMVLKVDKENERISLGLKQVEPDPWLTLDERYPVNSLVTGKVRNLTNFGAFVELEDGIDGLVHISDMSWTRRVGHPSEILKKGDEVTVRVLSLDKENRRVSLGLKQVEDDPWPKLIEKYPVNSEVEATIAKVIDRGAVVMLEDEVEGFVPAGQLGIDDLHDPREHFSQGDRLTLKLTRVDPANRRILLSAKAYLAEQDEETRAAYLAKHGAKRPAEAPEAPDDASGADASPPPEDAPRQAEGKPSPEAEAGTAQAAAAEKSSEPSGDAPASAPSDAAKAPDDARHDEASPAEAEPKAEEKASPRAAAEAPQAAERESAPESDPEKPADEKKEE